MIILYAWIAIIIGTLTLAWLAHEGVFSGPTGCHAREDAPTLGDALAWWLREHLAAAWGCVHVAADAAADWRILRHPWLLLPYERWRIVQAHWYRQYRRADRKAFAAECEEIRLRVPAAASAPGDGTVPDPASGAVPLEVRATSSDGFPAVAFRAGKQPWETAGQPRLPDVMA